MEFNFPEPRTSKFFTIWLKEKSYDLIETIVGEKNIPIEEVITTFLEAAIKEYQIMQAGPQENKWDNKDVKEKLETADKFYGPSNFEPYEPKGTDDKASPEEMKKIRKAKYAREYYQKHPEKFGVKAKKKGPNPDWGHLTPAQQFEKRETEFKIVTDTCLNETCPKLDRKFVHGTGSIMIDSNGQKYIFCSDVCKKQWEFSRKDRVITV